jgi:hypothetical protein
MHLVSPSTGALKSTRKGKRPILEAVSMSQTIRQQDQHPPSRLPYYTQSANLSPSSFNLHTPSPQHNPRSSQPRTSSRNAAYGDGGGDAAALQQAQHPPFCFDDYMGQHLTPRLASTLRRTQPSGQSWIASAAQIRVHFSFSGAGEGRGKRLGALQHAQHSPCCFEYCRR